jgi:Trk K+ transport system NAD-binding subunit
MGEVNRRWVRTRLVVRQHRLVLGLLALWFLGNAALFALPLGLGWRHALATVFFFEVQSTRWGTFYQSFSDLVVFGLLIGVYVSDQGRRYRPEETCRELAEGLRNHAVIVGWTHLGERLHALCVERGVPVVVLDADRARVEALVREERPLVLGSGREARDLEAAGVAHAALVLLADDDLEAVTFGCHHVRVLNSECKLLARCPDEDVGEVLARVYKARVVSTSRLAAQRVAAYAERHGARRCLVLGANSVGRKVASTLRVRGLEVTVVDADKGALEGVAAGVRGVHGRPSDPAVLLAAGAAEAELVMLADDDLGTNLVLAERLRDANSACKLLCRVFHEEASSVLTQPPFRCEVVSTSRHAVDTLLRDGSLRALGLDPTSPPRADP